MFPNHTCVTSVSRDEFSFYGSLRNRPVANYILDIGKLSADEWSDGHFPINMGNFDKSEKTKHSNKRPVDHGNSQSFENNRANRQLQRTLKEEPIDQFSQQLGCP